MRPLCVLRAVYRCKQSGDALRLAALLRQRREREASHQPMVYSRQQAVGYKLTVPGQSKQLLAVRPPRVLRAIYRCKQSGDLVGYAALLRQRRQGEASHQSTVYSRQQAAGYRLTVLGQRKQLFAVRPPRVPCAINRCKQRGDLVGYAALLG